MSNLDTSTQAILRCAQALQQAATDLPPRLVRGLFRVTRGGFAQAGLTDSIFNKIQFVVADVDFDNWFDVATNFRYTPKLPGWYLFHLNVTGSYAAVADAVQAAIFIDGSLAAKGSHVPGAANTLSTSAVTTLLACNGTTDYVEGFCYVPVGSIQLEGSTAETYMLGLRIAGL